VKTALLRLGLLTLVIAGSSYAQTYTTIMSGEDSEYYVFPSTGNPRSTVTSVQSPFYFPSSPTGSDDTLTFPSGGSGNPWWFYYSGCSGTPPSMTCTANDFTGDPIPRPAAYGQISELKYNLRGLLVKATMSGTASTSNSAVEAHVYQVAYFTENFNYQGGREIGIARQMSPYGSVDVTYAYWFTEDNCGLTGYATLYGNNGFPFCRVSQTTGGTENPTTVAGNGGFIQTGYSDFAWICGPAPMSCATTPGTEYNYQAYVFWASWDSSYKVRVEVWNSSYTTELYAYNIDTTNLGVSLGISDSGVPGYVTVGTVRADQPSPTLSSSGIQMDVAYVQTVTP
jgi:hypothetical protein